MMLLFSLLLELSAAAVFLIPAYILLNKAYFHNTGRSTLCCVFSLYLAAVYNLVGMPTVNYVRFEINLNLIPFAGMAADLKNTILNVLLFIPLGFMLPVLWEKYRSPKKTVLFGLGVSLAIELLQMLTFRATDVNDLITNTMGAFLGYGLFCSARRMISAGRESAMEQYLVFGITFAVMFFLHPFLSGFLWSVVF